MIAESVRMDTQRGFAVPVEQPRTLQEFVSEVRSAERRIEAVKMQMIERRRQMQSQQQQQASLARWRAGTGT